MGSTGGRMDRWPWILLLGVLTAGNCADMSPRHRRAVTSDDGKCKAKFAKISGHSACLQRSNALLSAGISQADKQLILDLHNTYRSQVNPAASDMLKMRWDDEIAGIAQRWAENCKYAHDEGTARSIPGRFGVGQNIAQGYKDWTAAVDAWYNEKDIFTYGGKNNFKNTGHYTQIAWATTSRLGCGYADCSSAKRFYVCNYGPAGNIGDISRPYKTGASLCGKKFRKNKLCDCGIDCLNGGTWNLSACTCSCLKGYKFYVGDECDLDCSKTNGSIPFFCGKGGFDETGCKKYANVPYECPLTCKVCPWGGVNYKEEPDGAAFCLSPARVVVALVVTIGWLLSTNSL